MWILLAVSKCISTEEILPENFYPEEWVVRIEGGAQVASLLALQYGYKNVGLVSHYSFYCDIFLYGL